MSSGQASTVLLVKTIIDFKGVPIDLANIIANLTSAHGLGAADVIGVTANTAKIAAAVGEFVQQSAPVWDQTRSRSPWVAPRSRRLSSATVRYQERPLTARGGIAGPRLPWAKGKAVEEMWFRFGIRARRAGSRRDQTGRPATLHLFGDESGGWS